ncbi:adenosylmethionine--8-amino-7-oxononanoate transaminase [Rhizorhapis suberifaciens]|uniref:Adenosylmethionine-8-amino-7-oxononanoate aminotransferase n=1 Tax=Rhizorhapis suberifaciens TaxID=13656 RepID=A0A840HXC4_9SPHN|nr:adenosylmethionine--8-amino-7-oxononanoate transaminase [Rhizorhapis suberifaciens]MBB4642220.1 adenosylmethionine-8-amino-7-oxononanoate aminotransferase [Rhizorhapis suberifaciens]
MTSPIWHPFTQHGLQEPIPTVVRAEGALLHCADGSTLIDGISSWWVTTHGHCHPRIMAAITQQAQKLDQVIFAGYTHEPAEEVARRVIDIAPAGLTRVFFSDSGSTSVEVALKMALGYWHNRREPRRRILVLEHSYHGDTIGTMSVGERGVFNRPYAPLLFDVGTIPFPTLGREQLALDALEQACKGDEPPAAFIVEPLILGAGGMLIYGPETLKAMREICARHNVLFIADEVMTGWGRTGTLFACEQAGISPDIMCLSKGLTGGSIPLAVTLANDPIFEAHYSTDRRDLFYHSSSYTANPIACAAAAANLAIWREEDVLGRIAKLSSQMRSLMTRFDDGLHFENSRQIGAIAALDIKTERSGYLSDVAPQLRDFFLKRGILLRPLGNSIYAMPPYAIGEDSLEILFDAITEAGQVFVR